MRNALTELFNNPTFYTISRTFFLGELPTRPVIRLLDARPDDVILDVGCGTGFLAKKLPCRAYIGIDNDPKVIPIAKNRKIAHANFLLEDAARYALEEITPKPTKVVLYGVLHHLNDRQVVGLLDRLDRMGVTRIVTLDPVYDRYHFLNNALCRLDRGEHVRQDTELMALVAQSTLRMEKQLFAYANTGIAKYILFQLSPKK